MSQSRDQLPVRCAVEKVPCGQLDIGPTVVLCQPPPRDIRSPPSPVTAVLVPLILTNHSFGSPQEVSAQDPLPVLIVDVGVECRFRQPGAPERESGKGFHPRSAPRFHERTRLAQTSYAALPPAPGDRGIQVGQRDATSGECVADDDEFVQGNASGQVAPSVHSRNNAKAIDGDHGSSFEASMSTHAAAANESGVGGTHEVQWCARHPRFGHGQPEQPSGSVVAEGAVRLDDNGEGSRCLDQRARNAGGP